MRLMYHTHGRRGSTLRIIPTPMGGEAALCAEGTPPMGERQHSAQKALTHGRRGSTLRDASLRGVRGVYTPPYASLRSVGGVYHHICLPEGCGEGIPTIYASLRGVERA